MFKIIKKKDVESTLLEQVIDELLNELKGMDPSDPKYAPVVENLKELHTMHMSEKPKRRMSPDAVANIAANLLGIGMIMSFEKANVITTKAFGFIFKPKL